MIYLSLLDIANIVDAELIGKNLYISNISVDTRDEKIKNSLFILLKGKLDVNLVCYKAVNNGAICVLFSSFIFFNISQLIVNNVVVALGKLSSWLRKKKNIKILSVTGTTGKTSVKEITVNILKPLGRVLFNYKNLNNELGIPITLLKLYRSSYSYAVLELGANHINDIDYLSNIVIPDIASITNISVSHLIGFKKFKNIVLCKGKIFKYLNKNGIAILNIYHNYYFLWKKYLLDKKIYFFSINNNFYSNVYATNIKLSIFGSVFILNTYFGKIKIFLKLLGIHNILNSLNSVCFAVSLGLSLKDIKIGLENCFPIKGRLYPIFIKKNQVILDDTYNSNPRSLYYGINFLNQCNTYKVLVVGDMSELDNMSIYYHSNIGLWIKKFFKINIVLSIGKYSYYISKYSLVGRHHNLMSNLLIDIKKILMIYEKVTFLIKGSRVFCMDKILNFI